VFRTVPVRHVSLSGFVYREFLTIVSLFMDDFQLTHYTHITQCLFHSQMPITQCFILFPDVYYSVFYFIPRCVLLSVLFYSQMSITQCFILFSDVYYLCKLWSNGSQIFHKTVALRR